MSARPSFQPGRNIALKLPAGQFAATLAFYRDTLALKVLAETGDWAMIEFGAMRLHLDRVEGRRQPEIWLELTTDDTGAAARHLAGAGVARRDEVEPLPAGLDAFWIAAPSGTIHLVANHGTDEETA